jgi:hypothetical protein
MCSAETAIISTLDGTMSAELVFSITNSVRTFTPTKVKVSLIFTFEVLTAVTMKNTNFWGVTALILRKCVLSEEHIASNRAYK